MSYFITDKIGYSMTLDTSEKLKIIELTTYEARFPVKDKLIIFCYNKSNTYYKVFVKN